MESLSTLDPRWEETNVRRPTKYVAIIPSGYGPQYRAFIGSDERAVVEDALQERAASGRDFPIWFGTLHAQVETIAYRLAPIGEEEAPSERPAQASAAPDSPQESTAKVMAPEPATTSEPPPRRRGRPPGSKNKPKDKPPSESVQAAVTQALYSPDEVGGEQQAATSDDAAEERERAQAIMVEVRRAEYEAERRRREGQGIKVLMPDDAQLEQNASQHLTSFVQTTFGTDSRLDDLTLSQLVQLNALLEARLRISGGRLPEDEE